MGILWTFITCVILKVQADNKVYRPVYVNSADFDKYLAHPENNWGHHFLLKIPLLNTHLKIPLLIWQKRVFEKTHFSKTRLKTRFYWIRSWSFKSRTGICKKIWPKFLLEYRKSAYLAVYMCVTGLATVTYPIWYFDSWISFVIFVILIKSGVWWPFLIIDSFPIVGRP